MNTITERLTELVRAGNLRDGVRLLDDAIGKGQTSELWNDWATIQFKLGNSKEAERGYRQALDLNSSDRQAAVNLGLLLLTLGRAHEATPLLEKHRDTLTSEERAAIRQSGNPGYQEELALDRLPHRPKLSIVMPSNRTGLAAYARIFDACSCSSTGVEVIIRDNSGDTEKRDILSRISRENCRVLSVEPCGALDNNLDTLGLSQGEFVFFIADDDILPRTAIPHLVDLLSKHSGDLSISGITGDYVIEGAGGTRFFRYPRLDGTTAPERVGAYLSDIGANAINYSLVRRRIVSGVASFCRTLPLWFSFTDQLVAFMYLCSGRFLSVNRLLYHYDSFNWDTSERALQSDLTYFHRCGLDGSSLRLMWLISLLEGAKIVLGKLPLLDIPQVDRELVAMQWSKVMYARFLGTMGRTDPSSRFDLEAVALANKWKQPAQIDLDSLLADLSEFMALSNQDTGDRYFKFWNA